MLAEAREAAAASVRALADRHAANVLPVISRAAAHRCEVAASDRRRAERTRHKHAAAGGTRSQSATCWCGPDAVIAQPAEQM